MSHFTPGLWSAGSDADFVVRAGKGNPVATMNPAHPHEERAANARLISAAPDLLDLAQKTADTFADFERMLGMFGYPKAAEAAAIAQKMCRIAISKAVPA